MATLAGRYQLDGVAYSDADVVAYHARDELLNRPVTVVLLHANRAADQQYVSRLLDKAHAAALANLPHVAALYDQQVVDGRPFLVLEDIAGPSLAEAAPLDADSVVELLCCLAETLNAAETRGQQLPTLNERTLRLGNEGRIQILDLGLRSPPASEHRSVEILGQILAAALGSGASNPDAVPLHELARRAMAGECTTPDAMIGELRAIQQANLPTVIVPGSNAQQRRPTPARPARTTAQRAMEAPLAPPGRRGYLWALLAAGGLALLLLLAVPALRSMGTGDPGTASPPASSVSGGGASPAASASGERYVVAARNSATVRVRSGPGLGFEQVASLRNGTAVEVTGAAQPADGYRWVPIRAGDISGWCILEALRRE